MLETTTPQAKKRERGAKKKAKQQQDDFIVDEDEGPTIRSVVEDQSLSSAGECVARAVSCLCGPGLRH